ncbi:hypothetical protein OPV22_000746 [Ensete ventricosum]|uniref:Reticulon-like protein n=1 Tax=Ensete ventricosum TaxID=4639 RepID=A0AAV8RNP5_ENSVE|nr:hypothetical protein OPV22_000746 [Ensete ventricosum]
MPRIIYESDSNEQPKSTTRRGRPLHDLLGRGKVADILLWRNKYLSAGVLAGATVIWFLFEVAEYHFLTLLCHISITTMLVVFIWSNVAALMDRYPPRIPKVILSEDAFREFALSFHAKLTRGISVLHDIASGKDLKLFLLAIASLWVVSVVGSCCSSLSLLYLGLLCILTLPALYERYEDEVNHLAVRGSHDLHTFYRKLDSTVLNRIPRGPMKKMR